MYRQLCAVTNIVLLFFQEKSHTSVHGKVARGDSHGQMNSQDTTESTQVTNHSSVISVTEPSQDLIISVFI